MIVINAHAVNNGEYPVCNVKDKDFFYASFPNAYDGYNYILSLCSMRLPDKYGYNPFDIQVLSASKKGINGVNNLNSGLQELLNPPETYKNEKKYGDIVFREGDKVMQIKNNYQLEWEIRSRYGIAIDSGMGVFNGDVGIVSEIRLFSEEMVVEFDEGRMVTYSFKDLDELELAYAITIHKAQGSEYPAVLLPILTGPKPLLNRNLLYTAVTRARKCVTVVGSPETFQLMIENENEQKRYSGLKERIAEFADNTY
jgi:exodeoxyribonuclease V alpha subunit